MSDYPSVDYFSDPALVPDPYPYFDGLRAQCPVQHATPYGVMAITGYAETLAAYRDPALSSCVAVSGPFPPLPFTPEGDDISELLEAHRASIPMSDHFVTMDGDAHAMRRGLLNRLITPKRLSENEEFISRLVDRQLDTFIDRGSCELMADFAKPLAMLVIADLLGVPEADHDLFRARVINEMVGDVDEAGNVVHNPLVWLEDTFTSYITDRRNAPRDDVLTALAMAKFPDGSLPEVDDVVKLSTLLFAAGMETTTKLLTASLQVMAEDAELQQQLRTHRDQIPAFLEESLRIESPIKTHFRLARTTTRIGDVEVPAGTIVMLLPGAGNADPRKFVEPRKFQHDRPNVREHVAFGRGAHSCPGAPLARAESRVAINRILDRMTDIRIDESMHGPRGERKYDWDPIFVVRGLTALHLKFDRAS